jgi:hypothetical protein
MGNIIAHGVINRFVLTCTLGAFTFGSIVPLHASLRIISTDQTH